MDYRTVANRVAETLEGYMRDENGWEVGKKTGDILIEYKHSTEFGGYLYRGSCVYKCPAETVFEYVDPLPLDAPRLRWDKAMKGIEILKEIDTDLRVNRTCTHSAAMGVISPRDFVDLVLTKRYDNVISTNGMSIDFSDCPPMDKFVRGWNYPCGLVCIKLPEDPSSTRLMSLIQPDLKGRLPRAIVDSAVPGSMVDFFINLRKCLKEDGKLTE